MTEKKDAAQEWLGGGWGNFVVPAEPNPDESQGFKVVDPKDPQMSGPGRMIDIGDMTHDQIAELIDEQSAAAAQNPPKVEKVKKPPKETGAADPTCPHCGWDHRRTLLYKPTDEDRETLFESIVTGRPFAKTFVMADGRLTITVRTIRDEEGYFCSEDYARACSADRGVSPEIHLQRYQDLQTLLHVQEIQIHGGRSYTAPDGITPDITPDDETWFIADVEEWRKLREDRKPLLATVLKKPVREISPAVRPFVRQAVQGMLAVYDALCREFAHAALEPNSATENPSRNFS